jgi:hypothetical protein
LKPDFEIKHSTFHFCGTHLIKNQSYFRLCNISASALFD